MDLDIVNDYYLDSLDKLSKKNKSIFLFGDCNTEFFDQLYPLLPICRVGQSNLIK